MYVNGRAPCEPTVSLWMRGFYAEAYETLSQVADTHALKVIILAK
jgi:hypothetical protein